MEALLSFRTGTLAGRVVVLRDGENLVLGRSQDCRLQLPDPNVSRNHCSLSLSADQLVLRDLESTNGTRLNGAAVRRAVVPDAAEISLGSTVLQVTLKRQKQASAPQHRCCACSQGIPLASVLKGDFEVEAEGLVCADCASKRVAEPDPLETLRVIPAGDRYLPEDEADPAPAPTAGSGPTEFDGFSECVQVGRGAQGRLYRVHHDFMRRHQLLYVLDAALKDQPDAVARFLKEGQAGAELRHSHLLRVWELAPLEGTLSASLDDFQGRSLWDEVRRSGPQPAERVRELALEILEGLQHLHERQQVHGRLVPGTVLLGHDGTVRLSSCPLYFALAEEDLPAPGLARHFRAPERQAGHPSVAAGDLFSLGAVLYFALWGVPPERPWCLDRVEDESLRRVLARTLASEPERYGSCGEVIAGLAAAVR